LGGPFTDGGFGGGLNRVEGCRLGWSDGGDEGLEMRVGEVDSVFRIQSL
jgi:hypothetical protein